MIIINPWTKAGCPPKISWENSPHCVTACMTRLPASGHSLPMPPTALHPLNETALTSDELAALNAWILSGVWDREIRVLFPDSSLLCRNYPNPCICTAIVERWRHLNGYPRVIESAQPSEPIPF